jgi:flagellar hook-associated protein 1 FlgK
MISSIFSSLGIAREALYAQQVGLDITQNNIANVNTPGYTRQRADFVPGGMATPGNLQSGSGVQVASIVSYRDRLYDQRVNNELQRQGEYGASFSALQQVEALFNDSANSGLQSAIAAFFNSFSSLANAPENASLREQVLANGEQLGSKFRQSYEHVQEVQSQLDREVAETVSQINTITANIARLNAEVSATRGANSNASNLEDQRQELIDQLAGLVDISYYTDTGSGNISITTRQGALLVAGNRSNPWQAVRSLAGPFLQVHDASGTDITSAIQSGKLGGLLKTRDTNIPSYLSALDDLAAAIISRVNAQHASGSDLNGAAGGDFFVPFAPVTPGSNQGAARAIEVAITDPAEIAAASSGGGPGSNANAQSLAGIQNELLLSGNTATLSQFYSNLVFNIGLDAKNAGDNLEVENRLVTQLQNQRDSVSGVSLDEEAINIMRYQKAYEASARLISVIDTLSDDLLRIIGG